MSLRPTQKGQDTMSLPMKEDRLLPAKIGYHLPPPPSGEVGDNIVLLFEVKSQELPTMYNSLADPSPWCKQNMFCCYLR